MPRVRELSGCKILVVDDNADTREILAILFKPLGCELRAARDGDEGLATFAEFRPDLVLLDVTMPGKNGFEVCREIKARSGASWVPVVMLTALDRPEARSEGLAAGADEYLTKPFEPDMVTARVRTLLRTRMAQLAARYAGLSAKRPQRRDLTVLFADVRGFTSIADQLEPEDVAEILGAWLDSAAEAVGRHGGTVNKVMGDGLLVLFNDPIPIPDHALAAVRVACELRERALFLQAKFHTRLPEPFEVGIGIHTGPATVGAIGSGRVPEYTAIGATVNLAARLQQLAHNEILITEATARAAGDRIRMKSFRREALRGFAHPVRFAKVVRIVDDAGAPSVASAGR